MTERKPRCGTEGGPVSIFELLLQRHPAMRNCRTPMTNRYPATCSRCGHRVEPGQGYIERNIGTTGWVTFH